MIRRSFKAVARFILLHSPLISMLAYYNNFRTAYRLMGRSQQIFPSPSREETEAPPVSLIISGSGSLERLRAFLEAVLPQLRTRDELIVIDSSACLAELELGQDSFPIQRVDSGTGMFGKLIHEASRAGRNPLLLMAGTDILPGPGWLASLAGFLANHPEASFAAAPLELPKARRPLIPIAVLDQRNDLAYKNLAIWKNGWARAGGFPESLEKQTAQEIFLARLHDKTDHYLVFPHPVARLEARPGWRDLFRTAYQEGRVGLKGDSVLAQLRFVLPDLLLILLSLVLVPVWPWFGLVGLLIGSLLMPALWGRRVLHHVFAEERFGFLDSVRGGWLQILRFIAFGLGVGGRDATRAGLDREFVPAMRRIQSDHSGVQGTILFSSMVDWSYMFQRYQQMARQFAKHNYLVFYRTDNTRSDTFVGFHQVEPNLYVTSAPLDTFFEIEPLWFYVNSPWYAPTVDLFVKPVIIYDHCDDIQVSAGRIVDHQTLLDKAALVLASSSRLLDEDRRVRASVKFLPNGVDYDRVMASAPKAGEPAPADLAPIIARGRPMIGYTGALAQWFDYPLLVELCGKSPELEFVLIGTDYDHSLKNSGLLDCGNVTWLGLKPYDELFRYTWRFDVTIIPFQINEVTLATSPIKLYEYFACQKPVVSTNLPECRKYNEVLIASTVTEFRSGIQRALVLRGDPAYLRRISEIARENTWEARLDSLLQELGQSQALRGGGN